MGGGLTMPSEAVGLRLAKIVRGELILCEPVLFVAGAAAVDTVLRRAGLSGRVAVGETGDYWADVLDSNSDWFETVGLDRASYSALKSHWMRCRIDGTGRAALNHQVQESVK